MRLLVPDEMPISLLPEPENARLELSLDLIDAIDSSAYIDDVEARQALRRYEPEPECYCQVD